MAIILLTTISQHIYAQFYPTFGPEIKVSINGLTFDAMEPFISLDGNTLYFNSLNSGGNTNLYYATKLNDSTFTFIGSINAILYQGANPIFIDSDKETWNLCPKLLNKYLCECDKKKGFCCKN